MGIIKGFRVTAKTELGKKEIKRNSKIPLSARLLFKKKILSKDPYAIQMIFLDQKVIKIISIKGETAEDLRLALNKEMHALEGIDYEMRLI
jgi:hypothetical protein